MNAVAGWAQPIPLKPPFWSTQAVITIFPPGTGLTVMQLRVGS